jgi:hypothetical protein
MGVDISQGGGGGGIVIESDPTALKIANNLSDVQDAEVAKSNLGIGASKISDYDNGKTYSAGDQVVFSNKIYKFNAFIGAAGYAPDTHPAAWTELSAGTTAESEFISRMSSSEITIPLATNWSVSTSAGGSVTTDGPFARLINGPYTASGFSQTTLDSNHLQRGVYWSGGNFLWNRRISISYRVSLWNQTISPNVRLKIHFGTAGGAGFGIQKWGHQPVHFLNHDGTTERTINTNFNPTFLTGFDVLQELDGVGGSKLFINGNLVASSSQAPLTGGNRFQFAAYSTSAVLIPDAMNFSVSNLKFKSFDA